VALYYAVRDGIWYDPYYPFYLPEHYRASNVLKSGRGYCVCKASLLCALEEPAESPPGWALQMCETTWPRRSSVR